MLHTLPQSLLKLRAEYGIEFDHPWFWHYKMAESRKDTGLEGYYGQDVLSVGGVVLARDVQGREKIIKRFAYFHSFEEAVQHMQKRPQEDQHFYEVIGATTKRQKPYFDLDMTAEKLQILRKDAEPLNDTAIRAVQMTCMIIGTVCEKWGVTLGQGDIALYQTPYPEDTGKYSFHIVVDGVFLEDSATMKEFGMAVKKYLRQIKYGAVANFIDEIWDVTRQFRLFRSSKLGSTVTKQRLLCAGHPFRPMDTTGVLVDLQSSFVTNIRESSLRCGAPYGRGAVASAPAVL